MPATKGATRYQYLEIDGMLHRVARETAKDALKQVERAVKKGLLVSVDTADGVLHINGRQVAVFTLRPVSFKPTNVS